MIAGLTSTGVDVADLRVSPSAVTRHVLKTQGLGAGVHVGRAARPRGVQIRVFESPGIQMTTALQKEVEKHFSRQELRRAAFAEVGTTTYPARVRESYAQDLLDAIDAKRVRARGFRVAIDYGYSAASFTLPLVLGPLGVEAIALHGFFAEARGRPRPSADGRRLVRRVGRRPRGRPRPGGRAPPASSTSAAEIPAEPGPAPARPAARARRPQRRVAVPVTASPASSTSSPRARAERRADAALDRGLTRRGRAEAASSSRARRPAASSSRTSSPATTPSRALCKLLELLAPRRPLSELVAELPGARR